MLGRIEGPFLGVRPWGMAREIKENRVRNQTQASALKLLAILTPENYDIFTGALRFTMLGSGRDLTTEVSTAS